MKYKFTLFILLSLALTSCKKTTDVDVTVSNSGKLTYQLLDDAGKGLPNVKISLFDFLDNYSNTSILLDTKTTDQNGIADFGSLNPRNYLIVPDSPMVNNIKYNIQDYVQVLTGTTKQKAVKVSDFSGTFNFTVYNYYNNYLPQKNIGVLMIPTEKYTYSASAATYLSIADYKGVSNDAGLVSFKVPSNKQYTIFLYNTTTNASYGTTNYGTVATNATVNQSLYVYIQ